MELERRHESATLEMLRNSRCGVTKCGTFYHLFRILHLELMYCLLKYMLLHSVRTAWVTRHRFVECGPTRHDKRRNIHLFYTYTTRFGRQFRP
jgi:hypothetical protein